MAVFSKFARPETPSRGVITDRDLDIIEAILRYRFSPTSELVRLVGGNEDVTMRRLRKLWEWQTINRFAFPFPRPHSEFIHYLDNIQTVDLLLQHSRLTEIHPQMEEELRLNREADYATAATRGQHMKLGFLQHSLMISRFHFMLEMAGRMDNQPQLAPWHHGAELRGHKAEVPEMISSRVAGSNEYVWREHDNRTQKLPVEPDAVFSLQFQDGRRAHFCYEADRGTMPMADMMKKLRAYFHFIKRQAKHKEAFGVHPIRAVLIETTDEPRARKLMELAQHPAVIGGGKRSSLFWFAISPLFTASDVQGRVIAPYLTRPELVLDRLWATPDTVRHSITDAENSVEHAA
jgi:hypothetical protein